MPDLNTLTELRADLAREAYRRLHPGQIGLHDSQRSTETDLIESDRAYQTWDEGRAGYAPTSICERLADYLVDEVLSDWIAKIKGDAVAQALAPVQALADEWTRRGDMDGYDGMFIADSAARLRAALATDPAEWLSEHDAEMWPCDNYMRPLTCTKAGTSTPCGWCRDQTREHDDALRAEVERLIEDRRPHIPVSTDPNRRTRIIQRSTLNQAAKAIRALREERRHG